MKNIIFACITLSMFCSCHTVKGIKTLGDNINCFSKKELESIISRLDPEDEKPKFLFINNAIKSGDCIGLFEYELTNATHSFGVKMKVLRTGDKLIFTSKDSELNNLELANFEQQFGDLFDALQLGELKSSFLKGNQVYRKLY